MKTSKPWRKKRAAVAGLLIAVGLLGTAVVALAAVETNPSVPSIFNPNESAFQSQTHFLVFTGSDTPGENATTSNAYYDAIDPTRSKRTFPQWLKNAGFIADVSEWNPNGPQRFACDLPGCDFARGTHGPGIINTDAHAIVLNAADLGFVRNQFIRCEPRCDAPNPIIYTYLENYPVAPFATTSRFPTSSGYPTQAEAAAAIQSALTRPLGTVQRIADVAFEWAPPPAIPTSTTRYGQLYAFLFDTSTGTPTETIAFPGGGGVTPNIATGTLQAFHVGDPFPPNLDGLGFKQHPGVCFICHGGEPQNLTLLGKYPRQGNVDGFRFLPLDIRNLLFSSDAGSEATSRASQEPHIKLYNQLVLRTVPTGVASDDTGTIRVAHVREAVIGMYAGFDGDQTMSSATQHDFVPAGWREANGAPAGSEKLYKTVLAPSCRSCHFNREISLDFGTVKNFDAYRQGVLELALLPKCQASNPPKGKRPMALAHLTYQRFWEANAASSGVVLPSGADGPLTVQSPAEQIAQHFGFSSVAAYCATIH